MTEVLPTARDPQLRVLFCGINPGSSSHARNLAFAPASNRFWSVLDRAGFTPQRLQPTEQWMLPRFGLGITALVARPTNGAAALSAQELRVGVPGLVQTARAHGPQWIGFLGIAAYRTAFEHPQARIGEQQRRVAGARVWVLPNPSGRNRAWSLTALVEEFARFRARTLLD